MEVIALLAHIVPNILEAIRKVNFVEFSTH